MVTESRVLKESPALRYDEVGGEIIDGEIWKELSKFSVAEKAGLAIFLTGASRPLTLKKIEEIAGKI